MTSTPATGSPTHIAEIKDADLLRQYLTRDRVGNAYLLGNLDPSYMPFCRWYGCMEGHQIKALLLLYKGLRLPALLAVAPRSTEEASRYLDPLIQEVKESLPSQMWLHVWKCHRPILERHFGLDSLQRMIRMHLHRETYKRPSTETAVRRLQHSDTASIMELYKHYPDNFFEPYQLESGLYFGVDRGQKGQGIAAIAGIHVCSQTHDIAAIGNLVSHPEERQKGYATAVTTQLLDELFQSVSLVTLNVQEHNKAAIALYEKFGFSRHHAYFEGRVNAIRQ